MTFLFTNPPWFTVEQGQLRRGIRAGSRWPFTMPSAYKPDAFQFGHYLPYPFFMGSAAAYAFRAMDGEHTVLFRDSIARGESYIAFLRYVTDLKPDAIVIEIGSASWAHDRKLIAHLKSILPHLRVAIAGPTAATAYTIETGANATDQVVDAFLLGEYEKNAVDFLRGASGLLGFQLLGRDEMNTTPFPMYDEAVWHHYWDACPVGAVAPELQVWGSRGCYARCNFCSFPATMTNNDPTGTGARKIRFYDTAWLEPMIRERMAKAMDAGRPLKSVRFDGDTENAGDKQTFAIAGMMKRIGLPWSMMCRADSCSREAWQAMKDSGCFGVKIGFESGVDRIVNQVVNKNLDLKEAEETAKFLRSIGLSVHGTFMIGHPTETPEERQQTIDFIRRLYAENAINSHQLSGCAELDGTPLANSKVDDPNYVRNKDGVSKVEQLTK